MISRTTQRIMRGPKLAIGLLAAMLVTASTSQAQSSYQVTDYNGNVIPAAASLYNSSYWCYNAGGPPMPAQICIWTLRKLYGDMSAVVVVVDQPHGNPPGCVNGGNQVLVSGYTRVNCTVYASAAVYGQ